MSNRSHYDNHEQGAESQEMEQADRGSSNGHGASRFEHDDLAIIAHRLWEARGCPIGSPDEDWFHAAEELQVRPDRGE